MAGTAFPRHVRLVCGWIKNGSGGGAGKKLGQRERADGCKTDGVSEYLDFISSGAKSYFIRALLK